MTETEWLNTLDFDAIYSLVRPRATDRQARLFMVACCRLEAAEFFDQRIPFTLEMAERCADDPAAAAAAQLIWDEWVTDSCQTEFEREIAQVINGAWQLLDEFPMTWDDRGLSGNAQTAIAHAALMSLRASPRECFTGGAGDAVQYCARAIARARSVQFAGKGAGIDPEAASAETQRHRALADLFRDIFGNPFRAVTIDRRWLTSTVVDLAGAIYEERQFGRMPILADALMDAGCDDADVLQHCRGSVAPSSPFAPRPEPPIAHTRGCWVVDAVLGKV